MSRPSGEGDERSKGCGLTCARVHIALCCLQGVTHSAVLAALAANGTALFDRSDDVDATLQTAVRRAGALGGWGAALLFARSDAPCKQRFMHCTVPRRAALAFAPASALHRPCTNHLTSCHTHSLPWCPHLPRRCAQWRGLTSDFNVTTAALQGNLTLVLQQLQLTLNALNQSAQLTDAVSTVQVSAR